MAYGLRTFDSTGTLLFDSETAFGFIEIANFSVSTDGTTGNSASGNISGFNTIYPVYVPATLVDDEISQNTRRPVLTNSFNAGTGAWSVTQTWTGTSGGTTAMGGGRVIIFAN